MNKNIIMLPMNIFQIYLLSTFLLFLFGPFIWEIDNYLELIIYVIVYFTSLYFGYYHFSKKINLININVGNIDAYDKKIARIFIFSCFFTIFYSVVFKYSATGSLEVSSDIFSNLGDSYFERLKYSENDSSNLTYIPMQICTLLYVATYFYIPIAVLYWEKFKKSFKIILFVTASINAITWLSMGTNKGLGDLLILFMFSFLYKTIAFYSSDLKKYMIRFTLICLIPIIIFFTIFTLTQQQRSGFSGYTAESVYTNTILHRYVTYDENNIILSIFGDVGKNAILSSYGYVSMGYFGLAKCLELPFEWTYGMGHSRALTSYVDQYFGYDSENKNYLIRNERKTGWPAGMFWSTVFPWLASDLTFPGVALFMFFVGAFFCTVWKRFLIHRDFISLVVLCQITIFIIYIPANNQLFQSRMSFFGSISILIIYVFSSKKSIRR